jgi:hypothetical protein
VECELSCSVAWIDCFECVYYWPGCASIFVLVLLFPRFVILSGFIICLLVAVLPHCLSSMEIKCLASRFLIYVCWRYVSTRFYLAAQLWWLIFYVDLQERKISLVWTAGRSLTLGDFCCLLFAASCNCRFSSLSAAALAVRWVCASDVVTFLVWSIALACWWESPMCYIGLWTKLWFQVSLYWNFQLHVGCSWFFIQIKFYMRSVCYINYINILL